MDFAFTFPALSSSEFKLTEATEGKAQVPPAFRSGNRRYFPQFNEAFSLVMHFPRSFINGGVNVGLLQQYAWCFIYF